MMHLLAFFMRIPLLWMDEHVKDSLVDTLFEHLSADYCFFLFDNAILLLKNCNNIDLALKNGDSERCRLDFMYCKWWKSFYSFTFQNIDFTSFLFFFCYVIVIKSGNEILQIRRTNRIWMQKHDLRKPFWFWNECIVFLFSIEDNLCSKNPNGNRNSQPTVFIYKYMNLGVGHFSHVFVREISRRHLADQISHGYFSHDHDRNGRTNVKVW